MNDDTLGDALDVLRNRVAVLAPVPEARSRPDEIVVELYRCECDPVDGETRLPLNDADRPENETDGEIRLPLNDAEKDDPDTESETDDDCPENDADMPDTLPDLDGMDIEVDEPENEPENEPPLTEMDCPVPPRRTGPLLFA